MMEPVGISGITEDYSIQPSRTLLGCIIETKGVPSAEPGVNLKMVDVDREFDACSMSNISMQCMGISETGNYGEQLLPDQLLSFGMPKPPPEEKREAGKTDDGPDQAGKDMYEGLLDKCGAEDGLLTSSSQDWGYIESFISESKMELLDLCSKNELSVNLFSEDDVNNYMFDDDDEDSTLGSDMCSLKIRYESFQDNMREKTNVLHEETQFNFFPSVLASDAKSETGARAEDGVPERPGDSDVLGGNGRDGDGFSERPVSYFIDSGNSADGSEEFGVDGSSSRSSLESFHESNHKSAFPRKNVCASSPLNYGLREKRKVRYSDDYLYDVDSIENEKHQEKREQPPPGPREEQDDDWCPKKRKKSSRKESPVIIKYIIINKFKGDKHTCVKLGKIDPEITAVGLDKDGVTGYEKLAPLRDVWPHKDEEQVRLAGEGRHDGLRRLLGSGPTNDKHEPQIPKILTAEESDGEPEPSDPVRGAGSEGGAAAASGCTVKLDPGVIVRAATSQSRRREPDERPNNIFRKRKFKSEAGAPSEEIRDAGVGAESAAAQVDAREAEGNKGVPGAGEETGIDPDPRSPQSHTVSKGNEKYTYMPTPCPSDDATPDAGMPVIPGGYLQTLLDASDSLNGSGISMLSERTSREQTVCLSLEGQDFASLQMAQSCVLSPPSESELQQSPHNCPGLTRMWHPQLGPDGRFAGDIPGDFSNALPLSENLPVPEYAQLGLDGGAMLYDKDFLPEQTAAPEAVFQTCPVPRMENRLRFPRPAPLGGDPRLNGFDLVGPLSAPCGKDGGEGDVNENFLSRCSPKLVTQQSPDAMTPLRESTDLLDISNFTPDKFRHALLSAELSPPETPDLSPRVAGRDAKTEEKQQGVRGGSEMAPEGGPGVKWYRDSLSVGGDRRYRSCPHTDERREKDGPESELGRAAGVDAKVSKSRRKTGAKQAGGQTQKKSKASKPKASKGDKVKGPRQNSRASKKLKALLDEKSGKAQIADSTRLANGGFSENVQTDDQREFEEPSNILSNIASGMAEVQRFMMASIEPTWGPASSLSLPSESNSLSLKTLKILAGTPCDPKKKGAASAGGARSRKGGKNQAKFNPLFPQLPLGCNVLEKSGLAVPGPNGPAHKKMYRHKTSAKFPRMENFKGKQADNHSDVALLASFEKLR